MKTIGVNVAKSQLVTSGHWLTTANTHFVLHDSAFKFSKAALERYGCVEKASYEAIIEEKVGQALGAPLWLPSGREFQFPQGVVGVEFAQAAGAGLLFLDQCFVRAFGLQGGGIRALDTLAPCVRPDGKALVMPLNPE